MHIGLGKHKAVDKLEIIWADGKKETYNNMACNRYITIVEGRGIIEPSLR
jgi:hypothetical protein